MILTAGTDAASARLISAATAIQLAGDRLLPTSTARTVVNLAKAVRAALQAAEETLALRLLDDLDQVLTGAEDQTAVEILTRRAQAVRRPVTFAQGRAS